MTIYDTVMLVVVTLLTTLTTAKDGLQRCGGNFSAMKDNNGTAQCATSSPNKTVITRSKIDCMVVCLSHGCSCAHGANYHTDNGTCQMYSEPPDTFEQLPNCIFYQVYNLFRYVANCVRTKHICAKSALK